MINLSDEERDRFATWLEQECASDRLILVQMEKIQVPKSLLELKRLEVRSYEVIVRRLRNTETMTIQ